MDFKLSEKTDGAGIHEPRNFDRIMGASIKFHNFSADIPKRKSTKRASGNQFQKILIKKEDEK
jgi:hypothetical protein